MLSNCILFRLPHSTLFSNSSFHLGLTGFPSLLTNPVQSASCPQPFNLILTQCVPRLNLNLFPTRLLYHNFDNFPTLSGHHVVKTLGSNLVVRRDFGIVGLVDEPERENTLLLEVGLVNTGERTGENKATAVESGLESGMFSGGTFTI